MLPCAQSAAGIVAPDAIATAEAESAAINDSYAVLVSPLRRAEHLLELHGGGLQEGDGADPGAQIGFVSLSTSSVLPPAVLAVALRLPNAYSRSFSLVCPRQRPQNRG